MASKRRLRRRSCEKKVRHRTKEFAAIALKKNKMKYGIMHIYPCAFCGGYHIGHKKGSVKL